MNMHCCDLNNFYILFSSLKKTNHRYTTFGEIVPYNFDEHSERHSICNAAKCVYPFQNQQIFQHES